MIGTTLRWAGRILLLSVFVDGWIADCAEEAAPAETRPFAPGTPETPEVAAQEPPTGTPRRIRLTPRVRPPAGIDSRASDRHTAADPAEPSFRAHLAKRHLRSPT